MGFENWELKISFTLSCIGVSVKSLKLFKEIFFLTRKFFGDFYIQAEILVAAVLGAKIRDTAAAEAD